MSEDRWLVVGLGNPESEYAGTRHNLGADAVRMLAQRRGVALKRHKSGSRVADTFLRPGGDPVSLIVPVGYMNTSGEAVQRAMAFYKAGPDRLVVVHDDLDLEFGMVRLKRGGGTGGHNGLKDIERRCGGPGFTRVRMGIGRPPGRMDPASYVLKPFPARDREDADVVRERAADAIEDLVAHGLEHAQNRHHAR